MTTLVWFDTTLVSYGATLALVGMPVEWDSGSRRTGTGLIFDHELLAGECRTRQKTPSQRSGCVLAAVDVKRRRCSLKRLARELEIPTF